MFGWVLVLSIRYFQRERCLRDCDGRIARIREDRDCFGVEILSVGSLLSRQERLAAWRFFGYGEVGRGDKLLELGESG